MNSFNLTLMKSHSSSKISCDFQKVFEESCVTSAHV